MGTASARRARGRFAEHLGAFYRKPLFWHRAYSVGSVGGAVLDTVRAYVESQGTQERTRKGTGWKAKPPRLTRKRGMPRTFNAGKDSAGREAAPMRPILLLNVLAYH